MITRSYQKEINAPIEKVWDVLWNKDSYMQWTAPFNPGSTYESDWKLGGRMLFLGNSNNGMISIIKKLQKPYEVVFEHIGVIENGLEDTTSDAIKAWAGAREMYFLKEENGITTLDASADIEEQHKEMMDNGFEKGFDIVKQLAENNND